MTSIAIVGTGIAGLGCGYFLHREFDVSLFDASDYAGGHTNTITVDEDGRPVPIDTGFMVFNDVTYPNLVRLFDELGVQTMETSMSFGVQHVGSGIEYCGSSVNGLFAQRRNILRPRFLRALRAISRFNTLAVQLASRGAVPDVTIEQFVRDTRLGNELLELYLLPIASAIWSTPFDDVRDFPIATLMRFFRNHGLLGGLGGHHQWRTVIGGAKTYVDRMTRGFRDRIHLRNAVVRIERSANHVTLKFADGARATFDKVIMACHADEALAMLAGPTADERRLLSPFRYEKNIATLHTDPAPMPRSRRAWASWNYRLDAANASTIYWMNSLQRVSDRRNYFVSINDPGLVDPARVLKTIVYHHPVLNRECVEAQRQLPRLNEISDDQTTYFCGSYFRYGFHEDAFASSIAAVRALAGEAAWAEEAA
jgi:predicted NAD/FAD-binding protein